MSRAEEKTNPAGTIRIRLKALEGRLAEASVTMDGKPVQFRFLTHQDKRLWTEFVNSCSERSLWLRFLSPFSPTPERAERFCNIDPEEELAVVAERFEEQHRKLIAVARLVRCRDRDQAEYAVIVTDAWQKMTLGRILSELCVELAAQLDFRIVHAETVLENFPMTRILNRCRFELRKKEENMVRLALTFQQI